MIIAYYRVSSDKQERSGLGLKAQAAAVSAHCKAKGEKLIQSYTEVMSGRRRNRPVLRQALAHCESSKATLVVAKLDRLARDVRTLLQILDSPVRVIFLDLPDADPKNRPEDRLAITIMAAMAEFEARRIGQRVKDSSYHRSKSSIKREVKHLKKIAKNARIKQSQSAANFLAKILPLIQELRKRRSLESVAAELNRRKIYTYAGKEWTMANVDRVLAKGRKAK